jgi:hypothetical protein
MPEIRLLDTEKDEQTLREAWNWSRAAPRWFRESLECFKESEDEFIEATRNEMLFLVTDTEPTAVIRLVPTGEKRFTIHLYAKRKTDFEVLTQAGLSLKKYLFDKDIARAFGGWIPPQNRGVIKLYHALGFQFSGLRCFRGQIRGRVAEWLYMASVK